MAIDFDAVIKFPEKKAQRLEKLSQFFQGCTLVLKPISTWTPKRYTWPAIRGYSFHEEHIQDLQEQEETILQIRKIIGCSTEEMLVYLNIYHYWRYKIRGTLRYAQEYDDFPPVINHEYSCCLNCHKRQWRYIGDWRGPCPYCGYYDLNVDPRFSIELGERESLEPGETDIEI